MSAKEILSICRLLVGEADSIAKVTEEITLVEEGDPDLAGKLSEIRVSKLGSAQELVLQLTEALTAEEEGGEQPK